MARRFARRRKPRVAWMPTFGGAPLDDPEWTTNPWPGVSLELNLLQDDPPEDGVIWDAFPLTFDVSEEAVQAQSDPDKRTLRDIVQGNEWRLRRLVGKAFITTAHGVQGATISPAVDVALGFIVCNTYDDGAPVTDFNEVNPLAQNSMEDPWFWRRRWLLHPYGFLSQSLAVNPATADTRNSPQYWNLPATNIAYGSVADGPHIDAKTARVIHRSERLFGVLAARRYVAEVGITPETQFQDIHVSMLLDYRLLGSLRGTSYGNRGNAAR